MKKRLLGAVVLIALAVIFVPMLLPGSNSGSQPASVRVPPEPSGAMQTRILQVGPDGASAGADTQASLNDPDHVATLNLEKHPAPASQALSSGPPIEPTNAPAAQASAPVVEPSASPTAKPAPVVVKAAPAKPAVSTPPQPLPGGAGAAAGALYTVNLGIYADHASADKLVALAKQHGFAALASPETYQGKQVMRVRVGPFRSRAEAEAARLKLKGFEHVSMNIDAGVVNQTGDAPASALAATQPGAWAVQLGAFSAESQADALRDRLRGDGFDGYVDSVNTAKGRLWRVRAGPFTSREVAVSTRGQIADKLKIKGDIVTQ